MDETEHVYAQTKKRGSFQRIARFVSSFILFLFEGALDLAGEYLRLMAREKELFFGAALTLLGLLNFESDKFCDGNTANYLSCTRPSTFYYFDALDVALVIFGVFFILMWILKNRRNS